MWTSADGKNLQAELVDVLNGEAVLKIYGQTLNSRVPFSRLSAADRQYVETWVKPGTPVKPTPAAKTGTGSVGVEETLEDAAGFPVGGNSLVKRCENGWPEVVALKTKPVFTIVKEEKKENAFVYRSDHFEFISPEKLSGEIVREFSRLFETTFEAMAALPLRLKPKPPADFFKVKLFETKAAYYAAGGLEGSAGMYTSRTKEIMVPLPFLGVKKIGDRWIIEDGDGNGTLVHEVVHQVMHPWLGVLPAWVTEGVAEYITAGRYSKGRLTLRGHGKNMLEYRQGGARKAETLPLDKLMTMDDETWAKGLANDSAGVNYLSAMLLFYYFCHEDGDKTGKMMIDYFKARKAKGVNDADDQMEREEFLLRGRDAKALQKDFRRGLASVGIRID